MAQTTKATRHNRTITVDFQDPSTYFQLISDGKAFVECVLAFILSLGFQLTHKATCTSGGSLTRHSHDARVRLGGLTIWRLQCTAYKAVFTVLPHFVLRYRPIRPEVARDALTGERAKRRIVQEAQRWTGPTAARMAIAASRGGQRTAHVSSPQVLTTAHASSTYMSTRAGMPPLRRVREATGYTLTQRSLPAGLWQRKPQ